MHHLRTARARLGQCSSLAIKSVPDCFMMRLPAIAMATASSPSPCSCGWPVLSSSRCYSATRVAYYPDSFALRQYSRFVDGQVPRDTRQQPPWRILFFGTDDFAVPHLHALNQNRVAGDIKVVEKLDVVVPARKSQVGRYTDEHGLHLFEWPIPNMDKQYDVGVVVSFGHLIPQRIISMFPYGILNVHPSLLPRWRGASPILHTVLNGDTQTGISLMEIRPAHFDIGPLLLRVKYDVPEECTAAELSKFLALEGSRLLVETLGNLPTLERLEHEQEATGITYAHKLNPRNALLNWELQTVIDIDRQYRALSHLYDLRTEWKGQVVKLLDMVPPEAMRKAMDVLWTKYPGDQVSPRPGLPFYHKGLQILCICCKDGWVGFKRVILKRPMSALDFYNGYITKDENRGVVFASQMNDLDKYTFRTTAAQMKLKSATG